MSAGTRPLAAWGRHAMLVTTVVAALLLVLGTAAYAHVHATTEDDPDPGTTVLVAFEFDHGCDGQPTDEFVVRLPDGVVDEDVDPAEEDGWEATVTDGVITWSGGEPVPDHRLHAFRAEVLLPDRPGETVHFPTIQRCGEDEVAWIQIPGEDEEWDDLDRPAPELALTDRPAPAEPTPEPIDDETPPSSPDDVDDEPAAQPADTPVGDATDETTSTLVLAGLALLAAIATAVGVLGWRRARGPSSGDPGAGP